MNDLRLGLRLLWKDKAFTLTAVLTLAVCIGANTALFSIVHHVLLRPLPVPESARIVLMGNAYPGAGAAVGGSSAVPDYYDRLRDMDVFEEQADYQGGNQSIDQNGTPVRIRINRVTPSFFRLLRIAPALGRTFSEQEGEVGNDKSVVLSYGLWQSQFGGDPAAIGKDLRIDSQPYTVVGVMPKGFYFLNPDVLLWRPLAFTAEQKSDEQRHSNNFQNIGRLKPGASIERAQQEVDAINARNLEQFPALKPLLINAGFHTTVVPLQETLVPGFGRRVDTRDTRQRHGTAVPRGTVDCFNNSHVLQALETGGLRLLILKNAGGEVHELTRELVRALEVQLLAPALADDLHLHRCLVLVGVGEPDVALLAEHRENRHRLLTEAGVEVRQAVFRETDERHRALVDVAAVPAAETRRHRHHLGGLGAEEVAGGVDAVDPEVVHGAAAQPPLQPDVVRLVHPDGEVGTEGLGHADGAAADELDRLQGRRLEMEAVGDHQLDPVRLAGAQHAPALVSHHGHRLLAQHVREADGRDG